MKTRFVFIMIAVTLIFMSACKKEPLSSPYKNGDGNDGNNPSGYVWTGAAPEEIIFLGVSNYGSGTNPASGYPSKIFRFQISLDNAVANPVGIPASGFDIPHVGPGGTLTYDNVANDAMYTVESVDYDKGTMVISIATDIPPSPGYRILEFNVANDPSHWFITNSKYGKIAYLGYDDGSNNVYRIRFYVDHISAN